MPETAMVGEGWMRPSDSDRKPRGRVFDIEDMPHL